MTYTLALLGTDTQFTPGKLETGYDKAETLSYVSTLVASDDDPQRVDDFVRYKNSQVTVVDGPTTLGKEVGDRITRGVLAILEAVSRGEKNVSIIAHSRGAVEAILVAHELERIQKLFATNNEKDMQKSTCSYTSKAMLDSPHKEVFSQLNLDAIKSNIQDLKLSVFNIDPVPGGNYMVFTKPTSLAWTDPRMFDVPAIVKKYHQYSYLNERTRCFRGIIPKPMSKETEFKVESLPGHHGTGSGNLKDQQRREFPPDLKGLTVEHVQQLVLLKLVQFLRDTQVNLDLVKAEEGPFAQILGPFKDVMDNDYLFNDLIAKMFHEQYELIMQNIKAYNHFNTTSYAVLGKEQYFQSFIWDVLDQRIVRHESGQTAYLPSIVPRPAGDKFLNHEHASLYLNQQLGLREQMPLTEKIKQSVASLLKVCSHVQRLNELKQEKQSKSKLSPPEASFMSMSLVQDKMAHSVNANSAEGFKLILDGLSLLIDEVRRPFLMDLPSEPGLFEIVVESLEKFRAPDLRDNELAKNILDKLNRDLEQTIQLKRNALFNGYDELRTHLKGDVFFDSMIQSMQLALNELTKSHSGGDHEAYFLSEKILIIIQDSEGLKHATMSEKKKWIGSQLQLIGEVANTFETKLSQDMSSLILNRMTEALEESENYSLPLVLQELLQVDEQLERYRNSLNDFKVLYSELPYDHWAQEAEEKQNNLIALAAEYIVRERLDLENDIKPIFGINVILFEKIANAAYGLGIPHPLIHKLQQTNQRLDELASQLEIEKAKYTQQIQVVTKDLAIEREKLEVLGNDFKQERQKHLEETAKLEGQIKDVSKQLEEQVRGRSQDIEKLTQQLRLEKQRFESEIENLSSQLEDQKRGRSQDNQDFAEKFKLEKQRLEKEVERVSLQLKEQVLGRQQDNDALAQQLKQEKQKHAEEIEKLKADLELERAGRRQDKQSDALQLKNTQELHKQEVEKLSTQIEELRLQLQSEKQGRIEDRESSDSLMQKTQEKHLQAANELDSKVQELTLQLQSEKQGRIEDRESSDNLMQKTQEKHLQAANELVSKVQELTLQLQAEKQNRIQENERHELETRQNQESHQLRVDELDKATEELVKQHQEQTSSQQKILEQLSSELAQVRKALVVKSEEHAKEVQEHALSTAKLSGEIAALNKRLEAEKSLRERDLEQLLQEQRDLTTELLSDKEISAMVHISTKLIPLTNEYLAYLQTEAKKFSAEIDLDSHETFGNEEQNKQYQLLRNKYLITKNLLDLLKNSEKNPLPSERVLKFTAQLVEDEKQLRAHRDAMWKQYTKNCLIGLSIALTGFIPGLLILLAASSYYNKSSVLFFTKTGGDEYFDSVQNTGLELNK